MNIPIDMVKNTIHKTNNCGELKIIHYKGKYDVDVCFINTGFYRKCDSSAIRAGRVKDYMHPSVCGVGFIGVGEYKSQINKTKTKQYNIWSAMIKRCYSEYSLKLNPSYKGVTVCVDWFNFQVFSEWFDKNYIDGMCLDKDILSNGARQYNPENCMFVSHQDNNAEANAKYYKVKWCNGYITYVYNMADFCRENKLSQPCMSGVVHGHQLSHRGWSLA